MISKQKQAIEILQKKVINKKEAVKQNSRISSKQKKAIEILQK